MCVCLCVAPLTLHTHTCSHPPDVLPLDEWDLDPYGPGTTGRVNHEGDTWFTTSHLSFNFIFATWMALLFLCKGLYGRFKGKHKNHSLYGGLGHVVPTGFTLQLWKNYGTTVKCSLSVILLFTNIGLRTPNLVWLCKQLMTILPNPNKHLLTENEKWLKLVKRCSVFRS